MTWTVYGLLISTIQVYVTNISQASLAVVILILNIKVVLKNKKETKKLNNVIGNQTNENNITAEV